MMEIGSTLSHFRVAAKLGEGGMGEVWKAEDLGLHRAVALKVLSADTLEREDMRARFLREARTAAALNHPNICTIYEVGEVDEVPFIAMELIEGESLDAKLKRSGPLGLSELARIATHVADGLAAAHAAGIVHRDLKPGNVMLTPSGHVKILDFGLAKPQAPLMGDGDEETHVDTISAEMTREGTVLGTVAYMSPEQAEGKVVDSRSDIFSFGVLLYQMATGVLPFRGDTPTSTLAKILETEPEPIETLREGLPEDLDRIIRRCLQKRPDDRYNDTRDLVAEFRALQTTGETQTVSASAPARGGRSWWVWAGLAAVAVVAAVVLTRPMWRSESEPRVAAVSQTPSIAVLPFHNLSADPDNAYFSAGITEEIISKLSRIDGLEVASRSSVAGYTDPARDVQGIGRELGVRYLLDGSVRRAGDRVRVSAQFVDGATGRNLWSEDFEGSLEDVFAMQEDVALKIAERLDVELSPEEQQQVRKRSTDNVLAYDAYLRAMALSRGWGDLESLEAAIAEFEKALEYDPNYAAALAGIAFVEGDYYRNFDSSEERIERAEAAARRAVEIDPTMAEGSHALGQLAGARYDYDRAARLIREAVRLDPKEPRFWDNLSWALAYQTPPDGEGSVEAARKALELQPNFAGAYYHLGRGLIAAGRFEEARDAFEKAMEVSPDFSAGHLGLAQYYLAIGNYATALDEIEKDTGRDGVMVFYYRAAIHAAAGRADQALEQLEGAFERGFRDFAVLEASPYFGQLRNDPRFAALVAEYRG